MNFTATYTGISCLEYRNGQTYELKINNNSMMIEKAHGTGIRSYRSITEFLRDWSNISEVSFKKQVDEIEIMLNEFHNDLAKSVVEMDVYNPLSSDLLNIKEKIRILKTQ